MKQIDENLETIKWVAIELADLSENFEAVGNQRIANKLTICFDLLLNAKQGIEGAIKADSAKRLNDARNETGSILSLLLTIGEDD